MDNVLKTDGYVFLVRKEVKGIARGSILISGRGNKYPVDFHCYITNHAVLDVCKIIFTVEL